VNFCLNDGSRLVGGSASDAAVPPTVFAEPPRPTANQNPWPDTFAAPPVRADPNAIPVYQQFSSPNIPPSQALATVALTLGIFGVVLSCCHLGIPIGAGAVIAGGLALRQQGNNPERYGGGGLAIAGMVTGGLAFVIGVLFVFVIVFS
jgi:hypothetical protein